MAKTMKPVDAVMIGVGWTGGILARELTKAGVNVVGLERGDFRNTNPDFLTPGVHDELAYAIRNKLFQNPARDTLSFRNNVRETALPIRQSAAALEHRQAVRSGHRRRRDRQELHVSKRHASDGLL